MTENNAYSIASVRQIESLKKHIGDLQECKRLGFIFEDEDGVMSISYAGMGFLVWVVARDIHDKAEAFAAGYRCAHDEIENR